MSIYYALDDYLEGYRIADLPIRIHRHRQHPDMVPSSATFPVHSRETITYFFPVSVKQHPQSKEPGQQMIYDALSQLRTLGSLCEWNVRQR